MTRHDDAPKRASHDDRDADLAYVGRSVLVSRPISEVYQFWRDPTRFPLFMKAVDAVEKTVEGYVWTVRAPAGQSVTLITKVTEDSPDSVIAWESVPASQIKTRGRVTFTPAPAGRGTVLTADIAYDPPAGDLGRLVAKLFGAEPNIQARHELKRFKMLLEAGEIATGSFHRQQQNEE